MEVCKQELSLDVGSVEKGSPPVVVTDMCCSHFPLALRAVGLAIKERFRGVRFLWGGFSVVSGSGDVSTSLGNCVCVSDPKAKSSITDDNGAAPACNVESVDSVVDRLELLRTDWQSGPVHNEDGVKSG